VKERRRGQVLIIVGVVLSLLILSVAVTLYMDQLQYSQFQISTYNTAALNIADDFNRVLTNILAASTVTYNNSADIVTPRAWANTNFTDWVSAVQSQYSSTGIQSSFYYTNVSLGNDPYVITALGNSECICTNYSLIKLLWYAPRSISAISAGYNLSLPGQYVYGLRNEQLILLNTSINGISVYNIKTPTKQSNVTKIKTVFGVTVLKEQGIPADDLSIRNFKVVYFDPLKNEWVQASNLTLLNLAGGNYNISFTASWQNLNSYMYGVVQKDMKYFILWVTDDRGIMTESYSYTSVSYVLHQQALPSSDPKSYETYVLESLNNGSVIWFNHLLNFTSNAAPAPIPIPPVKQLRVYTNVTGPNPVPSQVEVWNPTYTVPTLEFANWRTRFILGDKLVYEVTFAGNKINNVNVTITWLTDADAQPPVFKLTFAQTANEWIVNNLQYSLGLVTNSNLANYEPGTNWIDYNLQVNATYPNGTYNPNGYHVEYTLFGYDAFNMKGGGTWFPAKLPWGPGPNEGWTVLPGPVRAVAYRVSDFSYEPPNDTYYCSTGEPGCPANHQPADFQFTQIILIPYNVPYFESYLTAKAVRNVPFAQQYVSIVGMIAGTERDRNLPSSIRPSWGSLQCISGSAQNIYNGSYTPTFNFHIFRSDADCSNAIRTPMYIGYWVSLYSLQRSQSIFLDSNTYASIASAPLHGYWFWTTADGARRVAEYDYAYWNGGNHNYVITNGTVITASFAGWIYQNALSAPSGQYIDSSIWQNGYLYTNANGAMIPSLYYKMFLLPYYPVITYTTVS